MTVDYSKMKVSDIRNELVEGGLISEEDAEDVKGKTAWISKHRELTGEDRDFNPAVLDNIIEDLQDDTMSVDEDIVQEEKSQKYPSYTSPQWSEFVMSLFDQKELINGNPNIQGLRRMVELLLGRIVISGPIDVKSHVAEHIGKEAVVTYEIQIEWKLDIEPYVDLSSELPVRVFRSVASSWIGNTDDEFAVFPEAIAETRAEGRALRKALRIDSVCAEELTQKDTRAIAQEKVATSSGDWSENTTVTDQQINTINVLCDRLNVDVNKFINMGEKTYESVNVIPRSTAASMIKHLNKYQSTGEDALVIPNNIKK